MVQESYNIKDDTLVTGNSGEALVDTYQTMAQQAETRGSLLGNHWKFYWKYLMGISPIFSENLSEIPPAQKLKGISHWSNINLRALFYLRALARNNSLLTPLVSRQTTRLLQQVSENNPVAEDQPLPVWQFEKDGDADAFYERWIRKPHPVVIKGFKSKAQLWSVQGLADRFSETKVIFTNQDAQNYKAPLSHLFEDPNSVVHNCGSLFVEHPEIINELSMKSFEPYMRARGPVGQLFFANKKGTGTPLHCASNFNLFFQFEGRKRWWFIDPNHTMLLYPFSTDTNAYQVSTVSMPNNPDIEKNFPLFKYCPRYRVELEPGDVLLSPSWWYHAVENVTERTLAAASRWFPPDMVDTNRLYSVLHTEPRFILYILRTVLAAKKRGERINSWLFLEQTAHDNAMERAASAEGKAAWGIN